MDGSRFDDLTRSLATGTDRRRFARGLAAGLGAALGLASLRPGAAAPREGGGKPQGRCPDGYTNCRGNCVILAADENNCGACAVVCPAGWDCCHGSCTAPDGFLSDPANCGACGQSCASGQACVDGACTCTETSCAADEFCHLDTHQCEHCHGAGGSCTIGGGVLTARACCSGTCVGTCRDVCSVDTDCPIGKCCVHVDPEPEFTFTYCAFSQEEECI
jgi:hypothetical protein